MAAWIKDVHLKYFLSLRAERETTALTCLHPPLGPSAWYRYCTMRALGSPHPHPATTTCFLTAPCHQTPHPLQFYLLKPIRLSKIFSNKPFPLLNSLSSASTAHSQALGALATLVVSQQFSFCHPQAGYKFLSGWDFFYLPLTDKMEVIVQCLYSKWDSLASNPSFPLGNCDLEQTVGIIRILCLIGMLWFNNMKS